MKNKNIFKKNRNIFLRFSCVCDALFLKYIDKVIY